MAINSEKSKEFEYRYMSSLVLQAKPDSGRERGGPTGEADSLRGTKLYHMGDKVTHEKPPEFEDMKEKAMKRKAIEQEKEIELSEKRNKVHLEQEHRSVLTEISHINYKRYEPLNQESKNAYGKFLLLVGEKFGEVSENGLYDAAEEVLIILKSDDPSTKYNQCKELLETLSEDEYNNLMKLSREITDFHLEEEMELDDPDAEEERNGNTEDDSVAVRIEEESEESEVDEIRDDSSSSESSSEEDESSNENYMINEDGNGRIENKNRIDDSNEEDKYKISVSKIDAYWIQREIEKYVNDPDKSNQLAQTVLDCLEGEDEPSLLETKLVKILGVDKIQFIQLLLNNRSKIYYITKLKRAQSDEEKKMIIEKMENDINGGGPAILEEMNQTAKADSWEKKMRKTWKK